MMNGDREEKNPMSEGESFRCFKCHWVTKALDAKDLDKQLKDGCCPKCGADAIMDCGD